MMNTVYDEKIIRKLQTVGISTFLKYYFVFKYYPKDKCLLAFEEKDNKLSLKSKVTVTNAAKAIFENEWNIPALLYIRDNASKVDIRRKCEAAWYLNLEMDTELL